MPSWLRAMLLFLMTGATEAHEGNEQGLRDSKGPDLLPLRPCSPCLKLKPVSNGVKSGFVMVNVEPYGGGLWHTWFDRDLSVAGRVLVQKGDHLLQRLVSLESAYLSGS